MKSNLKCLHNYKNKYLHGEHGSLKHSKTSGSKEKTCVFSLALNGHTSGSSYFALYM
jgi:hypothetical protein